MKIDTAIRCAIHDLPICKETKWRCLPCQCECICGGQKQDGLPRMSVLCPICDFKMMGRGSQPDDKSSSSVR